MKRNFCIQNIVNDYSKIDLMKGKIFLLKLKQYFLSAFREKAIDLFK